jgi:hypothetical protein
MIQNHTADNIVYYQLKGGFDFCNLLLSWWNFAGKTYFESYGFIIPQ